MSGVNPVILIQLLQEYDRYSPEGKRVFTFTKNERMRVHKETDAEAFRRKSRLTPNTVLHTEYILRKKLMEVLRGRIREKVWIDPEMDNVALPTQMATGETGFGILPTGSRVKIPEGKFIRAFTYWEKVNDIDLSCFGLTEDGRREEFSWRNMYAKQGADITYSGDQTSGYNGGSEYFDLDIDLFRRNRPGYRYVVFCNNVYSGIDFSQCFCKAGFMVRDTAAAPCWKGERNSKSIPDSGRIFNPKTVATSFRINADSTFCYLFAIDLQERQMIWLNMARSDNLRVAGQENMEFLTRWFRATDVMNLGMLFRYMAENIVDTPAEADLIIGDGVYAIPEDRVRKIRTIHSYDFEQVLPYLKT